MGHFDVSRYTLLLAAGALTACGGLQPQPPSTAHINKDAVAPPRDIPAPVAVTTTLPRPKPAAKVETYSVSVRNIPIQELLFALARDAKLNVDIHPGISGVVTINAIDQTLQQILTRLSRQIDMRWELDGPNLAVMPDSPFLRNYKVDYVNISRELTGSVSINTQIASTSTGATGTSTTSTGNNSSTSVKSSAQNNFWQSLEKNLKDLLRETDKILPEGSSETVIERDDRQATTGTGAQQSGTSARSTTSSGIANSPNPAALQQSGTTVVKRTTFREAASIIVNPEAGVVVVRATSRQHEKVQEYLDLVLTNARRQVIIEATIAEVNLNDAYQQGINWQSLRTQRPGNRTAGFSVGQNPTTTTDTVGIDAGAYSMSGSAPTFGTSAGGFAFLLNYVAPGLGLASTLSLLESFGKVKVLSSPKLSVLNNQTAMLKVVNNLVYFEIKSDLIPSSTTGTPPVPSVTATPKSVAVGLVMSVTPQISENGSILLNVRPTISSKTDDVTDPTPNLTVPNKVPVIQTREMESLLRLADGEIAVMGGLMEDKISNNTNQTPGLGDLPGIGNFFRNRSDTAQKTELVIFLKPTIIREPSINGDYKAFGSLLPSPTLLLDEFKKQKLPPAGNSGERQQ